MSEILLYCFSGTRAEQALPGMLEKSLERGWRAVVRTGSPERAEALNAMLWTRREEDFLPHGTRSDGHVEAQPVYLTAEDENPNEADVIFLLDDVHDLAIDGYRRCVVLCEGETGDVRSRWTAIAGDVHDLTCWKQSDAGKWVQEK